MSRRIEILSAISAYGVWKTRLRSAVRTGVAEPTPEQAAVDTECELGKLLSAIPPAERDGPHFAKVRDLHARFHEEAAGVLRLVASGETAKAGQALENGSGFERVSRQLTMALIEWSKAA